MFATYQINSDELNFDFLKSIKETFKGKAIEISIMDYDETDYLLRSPKNKEILLERINDVKNGKNLTTLSVEEFEKLL
jgi:antitoxin YefM